MVQTPQRGRPRKSPKLRRTRRLQVLLTPAEHKALNTYARERDTSVSELLRDYIKRLLAEEGGA